MKTIKMILVVTLVGLLTLTSCKYKSGDRMPSTNSERIDSVSYALGMYMGNMIKSSDFGELSYCKIYKGMKDILEGKDIKINEQEVMNLIQNYLIERQSYSSEKNAADSKKFLEENKTKEGVIETPTGLQYKIITEGTGIAPAETDTVEINYKGYFIDKTVFDSSYDRGETAKFPLNGVIPGWTEGMQNIKEGGKIELYIPANLGYGERGYNTIPGNSLLIFEVELIKVSKAAPVVEEQVKK